jgi:hypothetical protein
MPQEQVIPVPEVMKQLIQHQNEVLNQLQQELLDKLGAANVELMDIMKLNPAEGWKLDLNRMAYVRTVLEPPADEEPTV